MRVFLALAAAAIAFTTVSLVTAMPTQAQSTITIGVVPSVPAAATYLAVEKGYFKDAGISVDLENIDSSSTAMALLAKNQMQVVEGASADALRVAAVIERRKR